MNGNALHLIRHLQTRPEMADPPDRLAQTLHRFCFENDPVFALIRHVQIPRHIYLNKYKTILYAYGVVKMKVAQFILMDLDDRLIRVPHAVIVPHIKRPRKDGAFEQYLDRPPLKRRISVVIHTILNRGSADIPFAFLSKTDHVQPILVLICSRYALMSGSVTYTPG